ncbi:MAG TPA: FAD-dependent oxidoreductase [Candidatus Thalassarchaeaceae archaeon]|nr:FAD-dependent oxidoreductase [Candidatus Thalassarchaeaceae archaeon]|tara:strand:+ start:4559 stop:5500 length:942 start_codon:yes stop_codon:yes gene_type:complete
MECKIVGAGVSGLSCAVRLLERGHEVEIISDRFSPDTVSDIAAALWYPFLTAPVEKTDKWGMVTYRELEKLAVDCPDSGVTIRDGREYLREVVELPSWKDDISHFRVLEIDEIPDGYVFGWEFRSPIIEMNRYMPWLRDKVESGGGSFRRLLVNDLSDVGGDLVVNCVGLGARELCDDKEVKPTRGQILYIKQDPGVGHYDQQPETLTYTIPRGDVTVLGGTAQVDDWGLEIREEENDLILSKIEALWPEIDRGKIIGGAVGLRPTRTEVRLEEEEVRGTRVIHNYGHGGAGITLSWGCADEVSEIAERGVED